MIAMDNESGLLEEFLLLLDKAGIALSGDRLHDALMVFADIKKQVAIVNGACAPQTEPSNVFVLAPPKPPR